MTAYTYIRCAVNEICEHVLYTIPARFLTARNVAALARIPSRKFQWYLWNVIDFCATNQSPEHLWDVQEAHLNLK